MQRVLIVYPFLPHYRRGVFLELDRTPEVDVTFASDTRGRLGIEVMDSDDLSNFVRVCTKRLGRIEIQSGVLSLLFSHRFDAVLFLGDVASISTWAAAIVARSRGIRTLFWTIGWHRPERGLKRLLRLAFYRLAHTLLLYGSIGRDVGVEMGYPPSRMVVIGNSIDVSATSDRFVQADGLPPSRNELAVGAVARITEVKGFHLLIDACAILRRRGVNVIVKLAGAGPALTDLESRAWAAGVPLKLTPPIYKAEDLAIFYKDLDATVVPQAIGLTAIQSLGFGVPAISDDDRYSQMPEWEAIVPGVTGELYVRDDAASLADAVLRVQTLRHTPGCVAACHAEYERWSPQVHARNILDAIGAL